MIWNREFDYFSCKKMLPDHLLDIDNKTLVKYNLYYDLSLAINVVGYNSKLSGIAPATL